MADLIYDLVLECGLNEREAEQLLEAFGDVE